MSSNQERLRKVARASARGMTLIEIMIVITILGMVAAAVAVAVIPQLKSAQVSQAKIEIQTIKNASDLYYNKHSRYPGSDEGIAALVSEKMLSKAPTDPWKRPYVYRFPGVKNPDGPDIGSYGADGQPGGTGENADLFLGQFGEGEGE
ncbi:MAG: type II secretion system major pseudopilin GspG [Deltaproteobacteria bacterium]|nr:type II secretion system major pseudopilin GspG [Deltaproteobacteria bacterium]